MEISYRNIGFFAIIRKMTVKTLNVFKKTSEKTSALNFSEKMCPSIEMACGVEQLLDREIGRD